MQNEVKLLLELLPKYCAHVERYPHTLLIKFYGLHRVVPNNGSKVCNSYMMLCCTDGPSDVKQSCGNIEDTSGLLHRILLLPV